MLCQAEKQIVLCAQPMLQGWWVHPAASSRQGRTVLHPADTALAQQQLPAHSSWAVAVLGTGASAHKELLSTEVVWRL